MSRVTNSPSPTQTRKAAPTTAPAQRPAQPTPPAAPPASKGWGPKAAPVSAARTNRTGFESAPPSKEQLVQEVLRDGPKGTVGEAQAYWDRMAQQGGVKGAVGTAMSTLLEVSGLPSVERSAAELGARVGVGDSKTNIAKAGGKLAFDSAMVMLNGVAAGKALVSAAGLTKAVQVAPTVVRHYTNAENAAKIMKSGEIWASGAGNAGVNKVYLLAEEGGSRGMNMLRRFNIGYGNAGKTAKAIEIDLTKLSPEVAAKFVQSAASGPLGLEQFVTHAGKLDFNSFRHAVRVLDTEAMAITLQQAARAGESLGKVTAGAVAFDRAVDNTLK